MFNKKKLEIMAKTSGGVRTYRQGSSTYLKRQAEVEAMLEARRNEIQCVMGKGRTAFGTAQSPGLADYADGVDIMDFLLHLRSRH